MTGFRGSYQSSSEFYYNYRCRITKNPSPIAAAPITTAGSTGDPGDDVGQGVGIVIVDFQIVVAVVTGTARVVSSVI